MPADDLNRTLNAMPDTTTCPPTDTWKQEVVYQIYPRSFCDSNGDGIGDLPGITSRLDYLKELGVGVVWLSPIYASPNDDNGYDISDYRAIMQEFGTMADFDAMLAAMHSRGIRLMMDLVVNHTSDEHVWFQQARQSRSNPYHDFYIWREPAADGGPPTNWEAAFNGSAWEWNEATGEYYLHMFSRKQPDLNWENPAVRAEVYALMHFWLEKGVDGFRMDVINMISKPWQANGSLPDAPVVGPGPLQPAFGMVCNGPRLMEFLREMRHEVLDRHATITVGECPLASVEQGRLITHPDTGALDMLFQFEHMDLDSVGGHVSGKWALKPLDLRELKATMSRWQQALHGQGWNSLYLSNHDQPRPVSRFGDDSPEHRVNSARMLATWLHMHQGTPFIYQGEELGMTNVRFDGIASYRDIETINRYRVATTERGEDPAAVMASIHAKSRDNARTPMQWTAGPHAGFTTGTPWLACNPNHTHINAAQALADPDSLFHHYQRLIRLRKQLPVLVHGNHESLLPEHPRLDAFTRSWGQDTLLVICNFSSEEVNTDLRRQLKKHQATCLLSNHPAPSAIDLAHLTLRPWESLVCWLQ